MELKATLAGSVDSRRRFISTASAAALTLALGQRANAQTATAKPVWLEMDQTSLDKAYDQNFWAPNAENVLGRYVSNSAVTQQRIGKPQRFKYGESEVEGLDLYTTTQKNAPIHIYIHGGAWRGGESREYAFLAEAFVRNGAHFIVPDFVNVIQTGGDLEPMVQQVMRSIVWAYRNAQSFGGDPQKIFISAHSSGAHLAAVALTRDWSKEYGTPVDLVKGAVLVSGLYDLKAARLSSRSKYVKFTDANELSLSPQRHLDKLNTPLALLHGTNESPEFVRQTKEFAAALTRAGKRSDLTVGQGYNHFEMAETVANPYLLAGLAAFSQLKA